MSSSKTSGKKKGYSFCSNKETERIGKINKTKLLYFFINALIRLKVDNMDKFDTYVVTILLQKLELVRTGKRLTKKKTPKILPEKNLPKNLNNIASVNRVLFLLT